MLKVNAKYYRSRDGDIDVKPSRLILDAMKSENLGKLRSLARLAGMNFSDDQFLLVKVRRRILEVLSE